MAATPDANDPASGGAAPRRPVTVVTGGSEGIGLAIAHRFAELRHDLLLVARRPEPLAAAAAAVASRHGVRVRTLALDLTGTGAPAAIEAALAEDGAVAHIIVNNAGVGLCDRFDALPLPAIESLIALNISALTRIMRHFAPGLRGRRGAGFLNVASLGGYTPGPYQAVYYASKSYVIALSEAVADELAAGGVRVCVVAPGPVETLFHARMGAEASLYRRLFPAARADAVAWWAVRGYSLGVRLILPGLLSTFAFAALRIMPHRLVVPLVGFLLKPRGREARNA